MPQSFIDIGFAPNDRLGDPIREAFDKANQNFTELYERQLGGIAENVYYVSKNGDDSNAGESLGQAFLTVKRAVQVVTAFLDENPDRRACIFVKAGDYTEINPIVCPPRLSIVGDSLRSVTIRPQNTGEDIFHIQNADYIANMTFRDHIDPDPNNPNTLAAAAIAYPAGGAGAINTSPYVQNCSSITSTGTGMRIDGNLAQGNTSMVADAFTQFNSGGIGVHLLNSGYAQLVSIFTICTDIGILCESGGLCSLTNSNTSFGTFGLLARGKVDIQNDGFTNGVDQFGSNITIDGLTERPNIDQSVSFDGGTTLFNVIDTTELDSGEVTITIGDAISAPLSDNTPVKFYKRSVITASSHTFEFVGAGNELATALPQAGGIAIQENEVVTEDGGTVIYSSTDHRGNFQIGDELTINGRTGTIEGDAFDRALFAVLTPYILSIEG